MSNRTLPAAVDTYLRTPKDELGPVIGQTFTPDAVVRDDGNTHVGLGAIRDWTDAVAAISFTRTITDVSVLDNAAIVQVSVAGDFPGSPVQLHHHFTLSDGRINALTICP